MTTLEGVGHASWRGRSPLVIAALIPLAVLAALPFRALVPTTIPGFSGLWLSALVLGDLVVGYLLLSRYVAGGSARLAPVAAGYLWSAAVGVVLMFATPGVISERPDFFGDANTVEWLWVSRHVVPPLLMGLALAPRRTRDERGLPPRSPRLVTVGTVLAVALANAGFAIVCALAPTALPTIVDPATGLLTDATTAVVLAVDAAAVAAAAVGVWRRSAGPALESWAVVAVVTFLGDSLLTALHQDRFTVAYYGARLLALTASLLVLGAVLHETARQQGVERDETARLVDQNADLRHAQRLRDHLTAVVSHDLRTPLAGLQGYLELLRDEELDTPLARRMVERSWMLTRRLTLLTEDLLASATLEHGDLIVSPQLVDVDAQLGECAASFPDLDLELDCPPGLSAYADPLRLQQVLANLVRNAQKHGAEPVRIAAAAAASGAVTFRVSDAGAGVPAAFVPRLFERYSQGVGAAVGGSGLGLSVVRDLVSAHGGTVGYEPAGNAFVFSLPARRPVVRPASDPAASPSPRAAAQA